MMWKTMRNGLRSGLGEEGKKLIGVRELVRRLIYAEVRARG